MKNKILIAFMFVISIIGLANSTLACSLSCAAICRYTCEGTPQSQTNCSEAAYASALQRCCEAAFRNTPGIDEVACGGES